MSETGDPMRLVPVQVDVTEQDITDGVPRKACVCMVAKAMQRTFWAALPPPQPVTAWLSVTPHHANLTVLPLMPSDTVDDFDDVVVLFPDFVTEQINAFDNKQRVTPFSFSVWVPAYVAAMLGN